jgi:hypothetical protein
MLRFTMVTIVVLGSASCGGGDSGSGSSENLPPELIPFPSALNVTVDAFPYAEFQNLEGPLVLSSPGIVVASSEIQLQLTITDDNPSHKCYVSGVEMDRAIDGENIAIINAAYYLEDIPLKCLIDDHETLNTSLRMSASDPALEDSIQVFLQSQFAKANSLEPLDPYSGYRRNSYYGEIYRFIAGAEIYANPELYGISEGDSLFQKIELYLINSSESFFEPCFNYDFYNGPLRQCRSTDRVGEYYLWRSPLNNGTNIRTTHGKVEWRAAGGISQAIKALLLKNPVTENDNCPIADNPSAIRDSGLGCRALNVRRLLFAEIWKKWSDENWVANLGYSAEFTIQGANVAHYIAWNELTVDMFKETLSIPSSPNCADSCIDWGMIETRKDDLLEFIYDRQGHLDISCKPPHLLVGCEFLGNEFQVTGSNDLSHLAMVIHIISTQANPHYCSSDGLRCISMSSLAQTMIEKTWVEALEAGEPTVGFPKFDMFFNGHCQTAYNTVDAPLQQFCADYWATEVESWPAHRQLFGWVNLGKTDRKLMILLRLAADENHDGLLNRDDVFINTFNIFLLSALAGPR